MHAMHAQHLVQMGNRKENSQVHRFPAYPQMNPVSYIAFFFKFLIGLCVLEKNMNAFLVVFL